MLELATILGPQNPTQRSCVTKCVNVSLQFSQYCPDHLPRLPRRELRGDGARGPRLRRVAAQSAGQ